MLEDLRNQVFQANLQLVDYGLVALTWGNASALSADRQFVVIKPSGISYSTMTSASMVVTDLAGNIVEGDLHPSSDLQTHLELYRNFPGIHGVVHTHSRYATALAQAEETLPCFGTTHADHFYGTVPCTRHLTEDEIKIGYERNTGKVIVETLRKEEIDPLAIPAILVCKHGPFSWGANVSKAVENALVLEETAHMAMIAKIFSSSLEPAPQYLLDKHYFRKHGADAYYGQQQSI